MACDRKRLAITVHVPEAFKHAVLAVMK